MKLLKYNLIVKEHLATFSNFLSFGKPDVYVILDTNVLIWLYRVNDEARKELIDWLKELKTYGLLAVPSWSIHEYNVHLQQKNDDVFFPLRKLGKSLTRELIELENYASLIASDKLVSNSKFKNRKELIERTEVSVSEIKEILNCLNKIKAQNYLNVRAEIEDLLDGIIMDSDIYSIQDEVTNNINIRYDNRIPPGFKDKVKNENYAGDLIIWNEVLNFCKEKNADNSIFLTLDNKTDWIAYPEQITFDGKVVTINYNNIKHRKYFLTNPSLSYEYQVKLGKDASFNIINIEFLTELLVKDSLEKYGQNQFRDLSLAVKYHWKKSPTESVQLWFLDNPDIYTEAVTGVCKWENSPGEVNIDDFKEWSLEKQLPNVNLGEIDWMEVFVFLFV